MPEPSPLVTASRPHRADRFATVLRKSASRLALIGGLALHLAACETGAARSDPPEACSCECPAASGGPAVEASAASADAAADAAAEAPAEPAATTAEPDPTGSANSRPKVPAVDVEGDVDRALENATLRVALGHHPVSFDPALVTDAHSAQIVFNTYEGLMTFDAASGPAVPGVATGFEVGDEGRTWTFELRRNARWSNGQKVTAFDFEYAWFRILDPDLGSGYAFMLTDVAGIVGASAYFAGEAKREAVGIRALDARTLEVRLEEANPSFAEMTALFTFAPVHRESLESRGDDALSPQNWVSNGPFVLAAQRDGEFVLRKNTRYWDRRNVELERVVFRVIEDDVGRLGAYDAGLLDWTGASSLPLDEDARNRLGFAYHQDPFLAVEYLVFNTQEKPLEDPLVREAIALAIDREELVVKALDGIGRGAESFVPPMPGYRSRAERGTDLDRARTLLAEAGHEGGKRIPPLSYLYPRGNSQAEAMAELVQDQLRSGLGIEIVPEPLDYTALLERQRSGDFLIARMGWGADYISPASFLTLFSSASQQNTTGWTDEGFDGLLEEASQTEGRAARMLVYERAEQALMAAVPVTPLVHHEQTYILDPKVRGIEPHVLSVHLLKYASRASDE